MSATKKPAAGDLGTYLQRGASEPMRCEILGRTAKRVRIWIRLASGTLAVRYVKEERVTPTGGGLLESGGGMKALMDKAKALDKIRKCLRLARSSNPHEVATHEQHE